MLLSRARKRVRSLWQISANDSFWIDGMYDGTIIVDLVTKRLKPSMGSPLFALILGAI